MSEIISLPKYEIEQERGDFLPALTSSQAVDRYNQLVEFVQKVMKEGTDYDLIPGTQKRTLLKPGAEKLCTLFGLSVRFQLLEGVTDWSGAVHGEPFFYYRYRCQLFRGSLLIAESEASCNSFEQKYRWRDAKRTCPLCQQASIFESKDKPGFYCWAKKGGCGAKFRSDDPAITGQKVGRVANPEIFDQVNTIEKIAQKRALVGTTLIGVNASEFFTQDLEDIKIVVQTQVQEEEAPSPTSTPQASTVSPVANSVDDMVTPRQLAAIRALANAQHLDPDTECQRLYKCQMVELKRSVAGDFIDFLKQPKTQTQSRPVPTIEARTKQGQLIASMGLVVRNDEGFRIQDVAVNKSHQVWRDATGKVKCSCDEFTAESQADYRYRCEHILAVKFHLEPPLNIQKTEPVQATQPAAPAAEPVKATLTRDQLITELKRGRRKLEKLMGSQKTSDADLNSMTEKDLRIGYRNIGLTILETLKSQVLDIYNQLLVIDKNLAQPSVEGKSVKQLEEIKQVLQEDLKKAMGVGSSSF